MEKREASPWIARTLLLGVYLIWVGLMLLGVESGTKWGGLLTGTLTVLIWLPFDVYRKRGEWLVWLPAQAVTVLGAALFMSFLIFAKDLGYERAERWRHAVEVVLSFVSWLIQRHVDKVMERRAAERLREFIEGRRVAPKRRPVLRFAGRPAAEKQSSRSAWGAGN